MALRMRVISEHRLQLGDKSTFVFGVSGGSIGRSAENDWVLPDDMRYVSGRHARIIFHKCRYLLQDTSSNGTYVNDNDRPLGSQNPHELKSGDRVILNPGIFGTIEGVEEDSFYVRIAEKTRIRVLKNAVAGLQSAPEQEKK